MTESKEKVEVSRRRFLLGASAGATAVAATQLASAPPAVAMNPGAEETRSRYRLSDDVKAFYRVNGYEKRSK